MNALQPSATRPQSGFSLIEILVGMAMGLVGIVVIFQMLTTWDARKRSTTAGSDAQISGGISMFSLEQDLKLAGWGFGQAGAPIMGCTVAAKNSDPAMAATPAVDFPLIPIEIIDGAGGAPDKIRVLYGNSAFFTSRRSFGESTATSKKPESRHGFQMGDRVVVADSGVPTKCVLMEVTSNLDPDTLSINHDVNPYLSYYTGVATTPKFNPSTDTTTVFSAGTMYNLGGAPQRRIWSIQNGRTLAWHDALNTPPATFNEVSDGIVNLQAEYGTNTSLVAGIITVNWSTVIPADWSKLVAVRVGLLARSQQFEKNAVTNVEPSWAGGNFVMTDIGGIADTTPAGPTNWRNYRYRVYEKVIPLRNPIWGAVL